MYRRSFLISGAAVAFSPSFGLITQASRPETHPYEPTGFLDVEKLPRLTNHNKGKWKLGDVQLGCRVTIYPIACVPTAVYLGSDEVIEFFDVTSEDFNRCVKLAELNCGYAYGCNVYFRMRQQYGVFPCWSRLTRQIAMGSRGERRIELGFKTITNKYGVFHCPIRIS